jgi:hypothetical protein
MSQGEIKITISGNVGEKDIANNNKAKAIPSPNLPEATGSTQVQSTLAQNAAFFAFASTIQNQIKRVANTAVNNIGNLTGDYILQNRVNTAINIAQFTAGFAVAATQGPVGLSIWGISTSFTEIFKQADFAIQMEKARINQNYLLSKNGQVLRDSSRGGF